MTTASFIKENIPSGLTAQRFIPLSSGRKHSGAQAEMVLERDLKILYLGLQTSGRDCYTGHGLGI